jgi:type II secretory pathway component PulM
MANLLDTLTDRYSDLTNREQTLLKVGAVIVPLMVVTFVGILVNRSFDSVEENIARYEKVIDLVNQVAPDIRQRQSSSTGNSFTAKFSSEAIENNEVGMTSFVSTHAAAAGVKVDSYNENKQPKDTGDDSESSLIKVELDVQINEVELSKLLQLLERIETSNKPVFVERIKTTRRRREKGQVRVNLVVTTYKRQPKEG